MRRYYSHPDLSDEGPSDGNVLYIFRLVVEGDDTTNQPYGDQLLPATDEYVDQAAAFKAVIGAAQAEAGKWCLCHAQLWDPSPFMQGLLRQSGLTATHIKRHTHNIASML